MIGRTGKLAAAIAVALVCTCCGTALAAPGDLVFDQVDINPGAGGSDASEFVTVGGTAYFYADDGVHGAELWQTDGGPLGDGTSLADDINPAAGSGSAPNHLTEMGGALYFSAAGDSVTKLWKKVPGSAATEVELPTGVSDPQWLLNVDGTLFFEASDGSGIQLYKSDGTTTDLVPASGTPAGSVISEPFAATANGNVFVRAHGNDHGNELWVAKPPYTSLDEVKDIKSGADNGSEPLELTAVGDTLYFIADDGTHGTEVWKSDGTSGNTALVTDVNASGGECSCPGELTAVGDTLLFTASTHVTTGNNYELWKIPAGGAASLVKEINPDTQEASDPEALTAVGDDLYFSADDGQFGREVWRSAPPYDSTSTTRISDIAPGGDSTEPEEFFPFAGRVYFDASDTESPLNTELYATDGSLAGTHLAKEINPSPSAYSFPCCFAQVGDTMLFDANDGTNGYELWTLGPEKPAAGGPGPMPMPASPLPGPTGRRAKALKKCKKKKSKKARKKCRKRAKKKPL